MTSTQFIQAVPIRFDADRTGVVASVLCAIHCALTPVLLLFAPTFGKFWSHPASHWVVALFVVPLAVVMMRRGFKQHRKTWVMVLGALGVSLVLIGAGIPYVERAAEPTASRGESADTSNESEEVEENLVRGCVSSVWLLCERRQTVDGGNQETILHFRGRSDAQIVSGLVAIVLSRFSGLTPAAILSVETDSVLKGFGLQSYLSSGRRNGLSAMVTKIRQFAVDSMVSEFN